MKRFPKRNTSELKSAKFLVLVIVKYWLDVSFGRGAASLDGQTLDADLDVKWSIDSQQCKATVLIRAVFL